jgi:two-component system, cell cycle sensor histidine kinase and response regulator CckA
MDSETTYRRSFHPAQDGILLLDTKTGLITDINPFLTQLLGYSHADLVGKAIWDLGLAKDVETSKARFRELVAKSYVRYEDLPFKNRDGAAISVEVSGNAYRVKGEEVVQCNIRDIRHREDAELSEQRLRHAHKMEAVGQLAGGLAHDFNNLLGVILGYCELIETQEALPEPTRTMVVEIHNAGKSAKSLSQRLLAFSRRQVLPPLPLDLNETVDRMQTMLGRLIGDDVALVSVLSPDLGNIKADSSQVEQILMNLAINARDAMPAGGNITIETTNIVIDASPAQLHPFAPPGRYVKLTVTDTGVGMDLETQARIFEPFFSTKAPGQGSGLGLATVFGIVEQSGGTIVVQSRPGQGASFQIYFPHCDEAPAAVQAQPVKRSSGGTETILLVDDADALRQLTRRLLEERGYTVLEASDPADALRQAAEHSGPLPLMITDVVMPGLSGFLLAEKLARFRPETKVLYASGFNDHSSVQLPARGQQYAFLEKPFTREDLLDTVRELLDSRMTKASCDTAAIFAHR